MLDMIFEVGFNYCCRNFFGGNASSDNLSLKITANLLNELTSVTENCTLEFSGNWAKTLSFVQPGMDMKISATLPSDVSSWNECVVIQNLSCPEPVETRYVISKISIVETATDRYMEFDKSQRIVDCKINGSKKSTSDTAAFPNHWIAHKRSMVEKSPDVYRPLTSITQDVPVINVVVAFLSNSPPGPYKFSHPTDPYVRTHIHVCDLSFRNLKLAAIRAANDDMKDVPAFHLHLQIDRDVSTSALPFLTVGDVLSVHTVKPIFAQKQAWNLLHKQKKFGETKVKVWPIESDRSYDVEGASLGDTQMPPKVAQLRSWVKNRLVKDSLIGSNHVGKLADRDMWIGGHDVVCEIIRVNTYTNSVFVSDYSLVDGDTEVEVRIRTSQQRIGETMEFLFTHLEKILDDKQECFVLLRNVRSTTDRSVFCSLEHVTRVPKLCRDVQELLKRKQGLGDDVPVLPTIPDPTQKGLGMDEMIPKEWKDKVENRQPANLKESDGCVDSSSQIQFEFVEESQVSEEESVDNDTQYSDEASQLYPRRLKFDSQALRDAKKQKIRE